MARIAATPSLSDGVADILDNYSARLSGNRLPSLLRELSEAIKDEEDEEDREQLRRLGTSLREMGSIARNKGLS